jgi:hypothetical protein
VADDVLVFPYEAIPGGGKPVVPLRLATDYFATFVWATLAPSLPRTLISPLWAQSIALSSGGTVVAQLQTGPGLNSDLWGPDVVLQPLLVSELDEASATYAEAEDVDWRERETCLVGHDFLCNFTVILDGLTGRLVLDTESAFDP